MTEGNIEFLKTIRKSPGQRIAVLFGSFFILMIFASVLSGLISNIGLGSERTRLLISASLQCVLAFCLPAFLVARFSSNDWSEWLSLKKMPEMRQILGIVIIYLLTLPAMEWLIEWNSSLHLPQSMSGLEAKLREWEENAEATTKLLLDAQGFWPVLAGVVVIGLLTGFSEELFFRGGFQGILTKGGIKPGLAITISAFLFSVMHFQFFGFVPRLLMGFFFGYLLIWTRSIWVPIFAHALNNTIVVVTSGWSEGMQTGEGIGGEYGSHPAVVVTSLVLSVLFFIYCRDFFFKKPKNERIMKSEEKIIEKN
ncbi:MAG: CPBP family intramembrane metalloprotease [Muribaculaceae bacterium]|nr:CPBP family intramembrane metalloprotease [Muribaculaceae bacterium]